nr:FAD-dependent oxidoreductase [Mesoplasma melaleucae]
MNTNLAYQKNRYDKGETSYYINCSMSKEEYINFYNELVNADNAEILIGHLPGEAELKYFEGCMPVEAMAKRGPETLLFGPMKPKGLGDIDLMVQETTL